MLTSRPPRSVRLPPPSSGPRGLGRRARRRLRARPPRSAARSRPTTPRRVRSPRRPPTRSRALPGDARRTPSTSSGEPRTPRAWTAFLREAATLPGSGGRERAGGLAGRAGRGRAAAGDDAARRRARRDRRAARWRWARAAHVELGGQVIQVAQQGPISSELVGLGVAGARAAGRARHGRGRGPAARCSRCSGSGSPSALISAAGRGDRHARLGARRSPRCSGSASGSTTRC